MSEKESSTKEKIIAVAIGLFKEKDYDGVTLQDICEACGISKHTFYYYFDSKDQIITEFVKIPYDMQPDILQELLGSDSPLEKYFRIIEPRMEYLEKLGGPILKQIILQGFQKCDEDGKPRQHKAEAHPLVDVELQLISQAQKAGEIRNHSSAVELVKMAMIVMISAALRWAAFAEKKNLKESIYQNLFVLFDVEEKMREKLTETLG